MNRRRFLQISGISLATSAGLATRARGQEAEDRAVAASSAAERLCLFTDHLDDHGYGYRDVARMLAELKIAGPDLTVRGGGLVRPEQAAEELPRAAAAFRERGLSIPMISTNLTLASDPTAAPIFAAMKALGIRYFKLGYYHYGDVAHWQATLDETRRQLGGLLELSQADGVQAGLHNHAGATVGGALWDGWQLLEPLSSQAVGFYFDPAQATIEGGNHAWRLNFQRLAPRLKMIAVKDFVWEKTNGEWRTRWVPLGEGMVRWPEFCRQLATLAFAGPISLHIEYDPGGSTPLERFDNSLAAAERDLAFFRKQLAAAAAP